MLDQHSLGAIDCGNSPVVGRCASMVLRWCWGCLTVAQIHLVLGDLAPSVFHGVALVVVVLCSDRVLVGWWSPVQYLVCWACVSLCLYQIFSSLNSLEKNIRNHIMKIL